MSAITQQIFAPLKSIIEDYGNSHDIHQLLSILSAYAVDFGIDIIRFFVYDAENSKLSSAHMVGNNSVILNSTYTSDFNKGKIVFFIERCKLEKLGMFRCAEAKRPTLILPLPFDSTKDCLHSISKVFPVFNDIILENKDPFSLSCTLNIPLIQSGNALGVIALNLAYPVDIDRLQEYYFIERLKLIETGLIPLVNIIAPYALYHYANVVTPETKAAVISRIWENLSECTSIDDIYENCVNLIRTSEALKCKHASIFTFCPVSETDDNVHFLILRKTSFKSLKPYENKDGYIIRSLNNKHFESKVIRNGNYTKGKVGLTAWVGITGKSLVVHDLESDKEEDLKSTLLSIDPTGCLHHSQGLSGWPL